MVHGTFKWDTPTVSPDQGGEVFQPQGFYCHRYVMASTTEAAQAKAFARVRLGLSKDDWLNPHSVVLHLAADEITTAPFYKLLTPENRGHSFYTEE
jgi:hypothetical protein